MATNFDVYRKSVRFRQPGNMEHNDTQLIHLYKNLSLILKKLRHQNKEDEGYVDSNDNAYLYILFVLMFYAFSIVVLMVKYIRKEREGSKLEFYYNEFVKRDWYKDKNLYDATGRRVHYFIDGNNKVIKIAKKNSRIVSDEDIDIESEMEMGSEERPQKQSVVLCLETASTAMSLVSLNASQDKGYVNSGARPKRSSLKTKKCWPKQRQMSFHQQSLEEALELRNVNSLESIGPYAVARKIDRKLSIDVDDLVPSPSNEVVPMSAKLDGLLDAKRKHFQCSSANATEVTEEEFKEGKEDTSTFLQT